MKFDGPKMEQALLLYGITQTRLSVLAGVGRTDICKLISGAKIDSFGATAERPVRDSWLGLRPWMRCRKSAKWQIPSRQQRRQY